MSNRKCCVPGCLNSLDTNENLHKFPNPDKDKELFNKWVYSVGGDILQLGNKHIFKYRRICHVHFENKYCCRNNRLSKGAAPTRNMPGLSVSKFHSVSGVLRPLQISEASTSKEPVTSHLDSVEQPHTQRAVEEMQIKEHLDPITSHRCTTVSRDVPMHATVVVEDVQINQNLESELDIIPNIPQDSRIFTDTPVIVEAIEKPDETLLLDKEPKKVMSSHTLISNVSCDNEQKTKIRKINNSEDADTAEPITKWSQWKPTSLRAKKHPALCKQRRKRPFEKLAESKLEIAGIQKRIIEEELENKRKQWLFEEEEREHKRAMWALEKQWLQNKIDKNL